MHKINVMERRYFRVNYAQHSSEVHWRLTVQASWSYTKGPWGGTHNIGDRESERK